MKGFLHLLGIISLMIGMIHILINKCEEGIMREELSKMGTLIVEMMRLHNVVNVWGCMKHSPGHPGYPGHPGHPAFSIDASAQANQIQSSKMILLMMVKWMVTTDLKMSVSLETRELSMRRQRQSFLIKSYTKHHSQALRRQELFLRMYGKLHLQSVRSVMQKRIERLRLLLVLLYSPE